VNPVQRGDGDAALVAYIVPTDGRRPSDRELRAYVEARLPSAMVPTHVVTLNQLPLTPNGKIDRKALPAPASAGAAVAETVDAPREELAATVLEALIADVWRRVLGIEHVGPRDHFFRLGGNSLTTIQLALGIRESLGVDLPLRAVFESPTLAELAVDVERRLLAGADADTLESLLNELQATPPPVDEKRVAVT
jgi:acyl carrier protein